MQKDIEKHTQHLTMVSDVNLANSKMGRSDSKTYTQE